MNPLRSATAIAILALALAGCGASAPSSPAPAGGALATYTDAAAGFAVDLPAAWTPIKVDDAGIDAAVASLKPTNPEMAALFEGQKEALLASGNQLFAMDISPEALSSGTAASISARTDLVPAGTTAGDFAASFVGSLRAQSGEGSQVDQRHVTLAGGADAIAFTYQIALEGSAGQSPMADATTYLLIGGTGAHTLTLSVRTDFAARYASTFDAVGQSFRVLP